MIQKPSDIAVCNVRHARDTASILPCLEQMRREVPDVGALIVYEQSYDLENTISGFRWKDAGAISTLTDGADDLGFRVLFYVHPAKLLRALSGSASKAFNCLLYEYMDLAFAGIYLDGTPPSMSATPDQTAAFFWRLRHELEPRPYIVMHASGFRAPRAVDELPDVLRFGEHQRFDAWARWDTVRTPHDPQCASYITWCHQRGVVPCPKMSKKVAQFERDRGHYQTQRTSWVRCAALSGCAVWSWIVPRDGGQPYVSKWHRLAREARREWGLG